MTTGSAKIDSVTKVPFLNLTQDPIALTVNTIASEQISPPLSPTSAQLRSKEQANDQLLLQKYKEACELNDTEQARVLFLELVRDMPKTDNYLLYLADCKLKLANIHTEETERTQAALDAKADLDQVYKNKNSWDSLDKEEKINRYKHLRTCLKDFEYLVKDDMSSLDNNVEPQIIECTRQIPLITDFYDKLIEGDCLENIEEKREVYHLALQMIKDREKPGYLLARAFGETSLALTHRTDDNNPFSMEALAQASVAYQQKDALFTSDLAKSRTLNLFVKLFNKLIQLFPEGSEHLVTINTTLEKCKTELARCQESVTEDSPNVSKEPVDQWKTARLVIAFGFAVAVIAGACILGRRYITRLN